MGLGCQYWYILLFLSGCCMVVVEADHRLRCSVTLTTTPGRQQVALASYRVPAGSVLGSVCTGSAAAPPPTAQLHLIKPPCSPTSAVRAKAPHPGPVDSRPKCSASSWMMKRPR